MGPLQNLADVKSWLRRRFGLIALLVLLGAVAGVLAAARTERVYSATAVLQVVNPVIAEGDGRIAAASALRRVQIVEQRLMSRRNILELIERYDLLTDEPLTETERVVAVRSGIRFESVSAAQGGSPGGRDGSLSAVIITTRFGDPDVAAAIANDLANAMVDESAAAVGSRIEGALRFFRQEEERIQQEIAELGATIVDFQAENETLLPAAMTVRREELARLESNLLDLGRELSQLRAERELLQADAGRAVSRRRITELDEQIAQRAAEEVLIAQRVIQLEALIQQGPAIERRMDALQRQMDQLQTQLGTAAAQRREAEVGQRLETDQQSEQFMLLEPAAPADYPVSRSRRAVAMMGLIAGLVGGVGLAFVMEMLQPVLRTARQMERELQLRPAISIPLAASPQERQRRQMIWGLGLAVMAGAALMLGGLLLRG